MSEKEHVVRIYLNGAADTNSVAVVVFPDQETKEKYIRKEYWYCKDQEIAYNAARSKAQREKTKDELYAKRVEFARTQGYAPVKGNRLRWEKVSNANNGGRAA